MLDAFYADKLYSIEDAVRHLRGLVHILVQEPAQADALIEASLTELLDTNTAFDPNAVEIKVLFQPIRKALGSLHAHTCANARISGTLPYKLLEPFVLHHGAGMSPSELAVLLDEPLDVVRQRIRDAERMMCHDCPVLCSGPIAA